jgi:hypothetical protein
LFAFGDGLVQIFRVVFKLLQHLGRSVVRRVGAALRGDAGGGIGLADFPNFALDSYSFLDGDTAALRQLPAQVISF